MAGEKSMKEEGRRKKFSWTGQEIGNKAGRRNSAVA
jgi:hypothetical protein